MKNIFTVISILFIIVSSCQADDKSNNFQIIGGEPLDGIRIAWDYSSILQVADKGGYPRLLRLKDFSVIVIYEDREGNIVYKRSYNNGDSWEEPVAVFKRFQYTDEKAESVFINMANPEIIQLQNGDIVVGCNYRPQQSEIAPFSIAIRRSTDNGATWLDTQVLFDAAPRFNDGCWEPAFLQLPDGELQVYFANEAPYQSSDEQEISMLSSQDNGKTWTSTPKTVSFRKDRRDGMPVPVILDDEIVVIIEDNYIDRFKPYTVRTKITDNWKSPVGGDSPEREYALTEKISDHVYMGAPYLIKLPTGETLISYQTNENRSSDINLSTMEVAVGDNTARNFGKRTRPFDVPLDKEANWNALSLWDDRTVVALASTNFKSAHVAPYIIRGYIIPEVRAEKKDITDFPIFVGSRSNTSLKAGIAIDNDIINVKCIVRDNKLFANTTSGDGKSDGVYLYMAQYPQVKEIYKFWCDYKGNIDCWRNEDGQWMKMNGIAQAVASENEDGYEISFRMSRQTVFANSNEIRLNIALSAYDNQHTGYIEPIVNSSVETVGSWLKIRLN